MKFEKDGLTKEQINEITNVVIDLKNRNELDFFALYVSNMKSFVSLANRQSALMDKLEAIENKIDKIIKD